MNMKKILGALLVLMVATLLFTGCQKEVDPNALPGSWSPSAEIDGEPYTFKGGKATITKTGNNQFTYICNTSELDSQYKPDSGFVSTAYSITTDPVYTGFRAVASSSEDTYYGFVFNHTYNTNTQKHSYYYLVLSDQYFSLKKCVEGSFSTVRDWTQKDAIKANPDENEVLVYKDTNSDIVIKINDTEVCTITSPSLTIGRCGICACVSKDDCDNNRTITSTFKFLQFQR